MSRSIGIDPRAEKSCIALWDRTEKKLQLGPLESLVTADCDFTVVIEDHLADVRIVRPAIVNPDDAKIAAEYEARTAMLGANSDLRIETVPIGNSDEPRAWLAVSYHLNAAKAAIAGLEAHTSSANVRFIPRSIALGKGFLHYYPSSTSESTVLVSSGKGATSICFIGRGVVIGRTKLAGVDFSLADDATIRNWLSEIEMVTKYRIATDLQTLYAKDRPDFRWIGDIEILPRLNGLGVISLVSVTAKAQESSEPADFNRLNDSCAAVGAALN